MKRYLKNTMLFSILCTVVMACGDREDEVSSNTGNNGDKGDREEPVAFVARITPIKQLNQGVNR